MFDDVKVTKDERKTPNICTFYDKTKGGVDIVDLLSSSVTTRVKTRRWRVNAFAFSLGTARRNARTLHREVQEESPANFLFTWNLSKLLVLPHIQKRYDVHRRRMVEPVTNKIAKVLGVKNVPVARPAKDQGESGGRCYLLYIHDMQSSHSERL